VTAGKRPYSSHNSVEEAIYLSDRVLIFLGPAGASGGPKCALTCPNHAMSSTLGRIRGSLRYVREVDSSARGKGRTIMAAHMLPRVHAD